MSTRPTARVTLGPTALDPVRVGGWIYDLRLTSTDREDDMVTIYVRGLQPSRMGTLADPATARVEDVRLAEGMYAHHLRGDHGEQLLAGIRASYGARP